MINQSVSLRLLITGANGFVGRPLCLAAHKAGYLVKAVTRKPHRFDDGIENIVISNFDQESQWIKAMHDVDIVVHLAARVHVMKESATDALSAYRSVNVEGTLWLARYAVAAGVRRFIYLSSIKVNGESTQKDHPFFADDAPAPEDPYGISKMEAEQALFRFSAQTGMEVSVIRPPLVYGPGVGANFAAMLRWTMYRLPLPLGALTNQRSMVALDNLLDLILICAEHPAAKGQVFLVSDGQDVSVTELLKKVALMLGVPSYLIPVPDKFLRWMASILGKKNMADRLCDSLQVDIGKTREVLGWSPPLTLNQGLKKTTDWFLHR